MTLGYIIIYVDDVQKTLEFYNQAFNLKTSFIHESGAYGELDTGATKLAFVANELAESNGVSYVKNSANNLAPGFEIALVEKDIQAAYQHAIKHGAVAVKEPIAKPWGQMVAYLRDLNGVLVELCTPMS